MSSLSMVETFFLCSVGPQGKIFGRDSKKVAGLLLCSLYELEQCEFISFRKDSIILSPVLPGESHYLRTLYDHIKEAGSTDPVKALKNIMDPVPVMELLRDYNNSILERHLNAYSNAIGTGLAQRKLMTKAKMGLFNGRTFFIPYREALPSTTAELYVDIMYQNPASEQNLLLWEVLTKCDCIPSCITDTQVLELSKKCEKDLQASASEVPAFYLDLLKRMFRQANIF